MAYSSQGSQTGQLDFCNNNNNNNSNNNNNVMALMVHGGSTPHSQGLSNIPYLESNHFIDIYFFKIYPNTLLPTTPMSSFFPVD